MINLSWNSAGSGFESLAAHNVISQEIPDGPDP